MTAVEYVSYADASGYGQAAVGYVRLLLESGVEVHWTPFRNDALWAGRVHPPFDTNELARGRATVIARDEPGETELRAMVRATSRPVRPAMRILHLLPRFWLDHMRVAPAVPHLGMTVWETSKISRDWHAPFAAVDAVLVPCTHNAAVLASARAEGVAVPSVSVVPHVCRPALAPATPEQLSDLAGSLQIRPNDTVFYCVATWDPRKRLAELIEGFARRFTPSDHAILIVKTGAHTMFDDPNSPPGTTDVVSAVRAIFKRVESQTGRPPGRVTVVARDEMKDSFIDHLHQLGHCYVSLARCEGFGLGSFDAATHGRPVIAVGYGGPLDYLGDDWPGRVPHRMVPCPTIRGFDLFATDQLWPEPDDAAAFALMRSFMRDPAPYISEAMRTSLAIRQTFGAREVGRQLIEALDSGARAGSSRVRPP
jgi:glycosyltransferase involved in cell wall biosynthesis